MSNGLFWVPLEGRDTAEIESFPSYLHRLALEHGVFVGEFIRFLERRIDSAESDLRHRKPDYHLPSVLVRPNRTVKLLLRIVERELGADLGGSILWFMDGPLGRSAEVVSKLFRWCPECFAEMERNEQVPYFKLIWHLTDIESCPVHGTPLETHCPLCGADQNTLRKRYKLSRCQHCGADLSRRKTPISPPDLTTSWQRTGGDIVVLFHDLAQSDRSSLPLDGVRTSLERIFDSYWNQGREQELYAVVPRDQLLSAIHSDHPMSLKKARRFAYWLGVSLFSLLSGKADECTGVLDASWTCDLHPDFLQINHKPKKDHKKIYEKVSRMVETANPPKTLSELAEGVGVSVGYLRHRYPELLARASKKRCEFEERKALKKRYCAQKAALDYFLDERFGQQLLSRKGAYVKLRAETGLPKWVLKGAIQSAYSAVYGASA